MSLFDVEHGPAEADLCMDIGRVVQHVAGPANEEFVGRPEHLFARDILRGASWPPDDPDFRLKVFHCAGAVLEEYRKVLPRSEAELQVKLAAERLLRCTLFHHLKQDPWRAVLGLSPVVPLTPEQEAEFWDPYNCAIERERLREMMRSLRRH